MKLQLNRKTAIAALSHCAQAANSSQMPVLSHVLVGENSFTCTNLDLRISCEHDGTADTNAPYCLPAKKLLSILSNMGGEEVILDHKDGKCRVSCKGSLFTLPSIPSEEFPPKSTNDEVAKFPLEINKFVNQLKAVSPAQCKDEIRYIICGVYMDGDASKIVATDGRRLHCINSEVKGNVILPSSAVQAICKLKGDGSEPAHATVYQRSFSIKYKGLEITTKLVEGKYPDYKQVIPKEKGTETIVPLVLLKEMVKRVAIMAGDHRSIELTFDKDNLTAKCSSPDGNSEESMPIEFDAEPVSIAVNPDFLMDTLDGVTESSACISVKDELSPLIIEGPGYLTVTMPLRRN